MNKTSYSIEKIIRMLILAIVFVSLTCLLFLGFKGDTQLTSSNQKLFYSLGISALLSGLVTLMLSVQIGDSQTVKRKRWFYPLMAGLLGLVGMLLAYIYLGVWPVGDKSVLCVDMYAQYAPLMARLRDMILHGGNFMYSFEVGLGGSFLPLFAYYLASPFNLLLVLFPAKMLTEGILVITLLKNALCASFFAACMQYVYRRRDISVVIVSIMYSMMMYLIAYSWNIMWLDCVMVLPLVILCFEKLMRTGKYLPYVLSLAYVLYANYYIGVMVCIFLVLYYICFSLRQVRTVRSKWRSFGRFAIGSLLGGGLVMFLVLPVYISLKLTSAAHNTLPDLKNEFDMFNLLGRHLYDTSPTIRSTASSTNSNLPNIYCGILAVFLLPIFATLKSIPLRRRVSYIGLYGVLAISLVINQMDLLWHGFHSPNDLPYRFSFLYCFVLLLIAYEALIHIKEIKFKQIAGTFFGILVYLIIEERFGSDMYGFDTIYISLLLAAVYAVILILVSRRKVELRPAYYLLLLVVTAEMTFNAGDGFKKLDSNEHFGARNSYLDNDAKKADQLAVNKAKEIGDKEANGSFYRMEFLPRFTCDDPSMFNYRGITTFASSNPQTIASFMGYMGYAINGVNSHLYNSFVPATDALLGIKYVILDSNISNHPQLEKVDQVTSGSNTKYIYKNNSALPLGYLVDTSIKSWSPTQYNPIVTQSSLYSAMTGNNADLYTNATLSVQDQSANNASVSGTTAFSMNPSGDQKTASFTATVGATGQVYIYVDCRAADSATISGNGNSWSSGSMGEPYVIDGGSMNQGDTLTVTVSAKSACSGNIYVSTLNKSVFDSDFNTLSSHSLNVTSYSESHISGTISASKASTLMTTIPYDKGWTIKVDGKKADTFAAGNALLAFNVDAGDHTIEMSFFTVGLLPGILISIVSLAALVVLLKFIKKKVNPQDPEDDEFAAFGRLIYSAPVAPAITVNAEAANENKVSEEPQSSTDSIQPPDTEDIAKTGLADQKEPKEAQDSDHNTDAGI